MQKLIQVRLSELSAKDLEEAFASVGAEIIHPARLDPVAVKDGKVLAFWIEV